MTSIYTIFYKSHLLILTKRTYPISSYSLYSLVLSGFDDWFKVECENSIKELKEELKGNRPFGNISNQNLFDVLIKRTMETKMLDRITEEHKNNMKIGNK